MPIPEELRKRVIERAGHVLAKELDEPLKAPNMTIQQKQEMIDRALDRRMQQKKDWEKRWIAKHGGEQGC